MIDIVEARRLIAEAVNRPLDAVDVAGTVGVMAGWDSIGHIAIVLALEKRIGRMLAPDEIGRLKSVSDVAAILSG
jgi:acyl carrier protein